MASYTVFISHTSVDAWVARQISHHCLRVGAETFLDEEQIGIGAEFEEEMRNALDGASELLVLVTPWAIERPYIWLEVGAAWLRRIQIVGILYGITSNKFQATSKVPTLLKKRNLIDINTIDRYFEELRVRVEKASSSVKLP